MVVLRSIASILCLGLADWDVVLCCQLFSLLEGLQFPLSDIIYLSAFEGSLTMVQTDFIIRVNCSKFVWFEAIVSKVQKDTPCALSCRP